MEQGKYIVLNGENLIAFDVTLSHAEVAKAFGVDHITSAGFISVFADANNNVVASCYGGSVTLKIRSNPDTDTRLARYALGIDY